MGLNIWLYLNFSSEFYAKQQSKVQLNNVLPLVGGMFRIIFMNAQEVFQFPRQMAQIHKSSYRQWFFDSVTLIAIREKEVEVSLFYKIICLILILMVLYLFC